MMLVDSPCFTSMEQYSEDHGSVHLDLCLCGDSFSVPHLLVKSAECDTDFGKSGIDLVINATFLDRVMSR